MRSRHSHSPSMQQYHERRDEIHRRREEILDRARQRQQQQQQQQATMDATQDQQLTMSSGVIDLTAFEEEMVARRQLSKHNHRVNERSTIVHRNDQGRPEDKWLESTTESQVSDVGVREEAHHEHTRSRMDLVRDTIEINHHQPQRHFLPENNQNVEYQHSQPPPHHSYYTPPNDLVVLESTESDTSSAYLSHFAPESSSRMSVSPDQSQSIFRKKQFEQRNATATAASATKSTAHSETSTRHYGRNHVVMLEGMETMNKHRQASSLHEEDSSTVPSGAPEKPVLLLDGLQHHSREGKDNSTVKSGASQKPVLVLDDTHHEDKNTVEDVATIKSGAPEKPVDLTEERLPSPRNADSTVSPFGAAPEEQSPNHVETASTQTSFVKSRVAALESPKNKVTMNELEMWSNASISSTRLRQRSPPVSKEASPRAGSPEKPVVLLEGLEELDVTLSPDHLLDSQSDSVRAHVWEHQDQAKSPSSTDRPSVISLEAMHDESPVEQTQDETNEATPATKGPTLTSGQAIYRRALRRHGSRRNKNVRNRVFIPQLHTVEEPTSPREELSLSGSCSPSQESSGSNNQQFLDGEGLPPEVVTVSSKSSSPRKVHPEVDPDTNDPPSSQSSGDAEFPSDSVMNHVRPLSPEINQSGVMCFVNGCTIPSETNGHTHVEGNYSSETTEREATSDFDLTSFFGAEKAASRLDRLRKRLTLVTNRIDEANQMASTEQAETENKRQGSPQEAVPVVQMPNHEYEAGEDPLPTDHEGISLFFSKSDERTSPHLVPSRSLSPTCGKVDQAVSQEGGVAMTHSRNASPTSRPEELSVPAKSKSIEDPVLSPSDEQEMGASREDLRFSSSNSPQRNASLNVASLEFSDPEGVERAVRQAKFSLGQKTSSFDAIVSASPSAKREGREAPVRLDYEDFKSVVAGPAVSSNDQVDRSIIELLGKDDEVEVQSKQPKKDLNISDYETPSSGVSSGEDSPESESSSSEDGNAHDERVAAASSDSSDAKMSVEYSQVSESDVEQAYDMYESCAVPFLTKFFEKSCDWLDNDPKNPSLLHKLKKRAEKQKAKEKRKSPRKNSRGSALNAISHLDSRGNKDEGKKSNTKKSSTVSPYVRPRSAKKKGKHTAGDPSDTSESSRDQLTSFQDRLKGRLETIRPRAHGSDGTVSGSDIENRSSRRGNPMIPSESSDEGSKTHSLVTGGSEGIHSRSRKAEIVSIRTNSPIPSRSSPYNDNVSTSPTLSHFSHRSDSTLMKSAGGAVSPQKQMSWSPSRSRSSRPGTKNKWLPNLTVDTSATVASEPAVQTNSINASPRRRKSRSPRKKKKDASSPTKTTSTTSTSPRGPTQLQTSPSWRSAATSGAMSKSSQASLPESIEGNLSDTIASLNEEERAQALELVEKLRRRAATLKRRRQMRQRRVKQMEEGIVTDASSQQPLSPPHTPRSPPGTRLPPQPEVQV